MKNKKLVILCGGSCLLLALFFGCGERSGEKEYTKALSLWADGDLVRAQGQLEKAIRKLTGNAKRALANNQLGIVLWKLGKPEQAIERFAESCRLTDELTGANLNLGMALYHAGQLDEAEFELTKMLNEQPDHADARTIQGLIHMQKKDWKSAAQEISTGLRNHPDDPAGQNALALAELHLNRNSDPAVARLKQVVAAYPDYAPACYNLAVIYDQWLGNKNAAASWYKQYLARAGAEATRTAAAKQAVARLGGKSQTASAQVRTDSAAAARFVAEGSRLHAAKKYTEAIAQYKQAIQADPEQKTAYYNAGLSHYELKQYPEAADACEQALKLDPSFANARYMLALAYVQQRKWSDAEQEAQRLKQVNPAQADTLLKYISDSRKR
jgi:tetratricopeptide (TPR) repeat protein